MSKTLRFAAQENAIGSVEEGLPAHTQYPQQTTVRDKIVIQEEDKIGMFSNWKTLSIAEAPLDIIDGDRGSNYPKQDDFTKTGYCLFLNAGNVTIAGFNFSDCSFISKDKDLALGKGKAQRDDVILTTRGTVGNVALYDASIRHDYLRINSGMVLLRANKSKLLPKFLYQFVRSNVFKLQIASLTTGSAQPQLPIRDIRQIKIPLPPLPVQRRIADILGTLDDKIELNRRMNATLEEMARALFKSWFVDFEPVRAKAAGQPTGLPAHIDALFPDRLVDSALGEIPEGWGVGKVGDIIKILSGGTPSTSQEAYWNGSIPWYTVKDAPNESDVWVINTEKTITELGVKNSAAQILPPHTTIISARGTVGKLALTSKEMAMNQSCFGIRDAVSDNQFYTYYLINNAVDSIQQSSHGTVFDTITRQTFSIIDIIIPNKSISKMFDITVKDWMYSILEHNKQNITLSKQRDLLLPELLSGKLLGD
jgi:type I restriction enzyme S subunit